MKKILVCLVVLIFAGGMLHAQKARQTSFEYQKGEKIAARIDLPFSTEIVEGAFKKKLESATIKEQRLKGMQVFKGGRLTPTDGEIVDFYFLVERRGKKEDNSSTVYLILGRPNENVALRTPRDNFRVDDAVRFLDNVVPDIAAFKLETDISEQEQLVKTNEKKLQGLIDDQKNLEARIRELSDRLEQNKRDQASTSAELSNQRSVRDALISKRIKSSN